MFSMVLDLRSLPSLVFLKLDRKWKTDEKFCDHVTSINRFKEAERVKNLLLSGSENGKFRSCPVFRTNFFLPYLPSSIAVLLWKLIRQRQPIKTLKLHLSSLFFTAVCEEFFINPQPQQARISPVIYLSLPTNMRSKQARLIFVLVAFLFLGMAFRSHMLQYAASIDTKPLP